MITRREFSKLAVAGLALPRALAAEGIDSRIAGVRVGVQTYSFRELPRPNGGDQVDAIIDAMKTCGLGECEVWSPKIEPLRPAGRGRLAGRVRVERRAAAVAARDAARSFLADQEEVRRRRHRDLRAGTTVPMRASRDDEIDRGFERPRPSARRSSPRRRR